jgi:hypothetical protein
MNRDELVELRKAFIAETMEPMRRAGDFGGGASWNRATSEAVLQLIDHLLERMRKP